MQLRARCTGFSLVELAVVFTIIALLMGAGMMTLSAREDLRLTEESQRRLEAASEAVLGFAMVYRRLPCPATAGTTGVEAFGAGGTTAAGGPCATYFGGFLPAQSLGMTPVDASGYALDAWGNRIRYAVAFAITGCTGTSATPHFTSQANLKSNGPSCRPNDLDVCQSSTGVTATSCNTAPRVAAAQTVAFIVYSTGKNGNVTTAYGADENANVDGDAVFVSRTPSSSASAQGSFDDLMLIVPAGVVYSKMVASGALP